MLWKFRVNKTSHRQHPPKVFFQHQSGSGIPDNSFLFLLLEFCVRGVVPSGRKTDYNEPVETWCQRIVNSRQFGEDDARIS